jgi:cell division septum initiation protein DivIVA
MAQNDSEFPTELRGYKRAEVDLAIQALRGDLIQAAKDRQGALEEVSDLKNQLAGLGGGEAGATFAGLGARLESILRIAEEQSTSLIGQADINAEKLIALAKLEAATLQETATREAERLTNSVANETASLLEGAREEAEKLVTDASEEAERVRGQALEEAASIRGAVATESASVRASAKRESEALRAEAARSVAETKVVAERDMNKARDAIGELEKDAAAERATHELALKAIAQEFALAKTTMEKDVAETTARLSLENEKLEEVLARRAAEARADIDAEISARRAEAEKKLLDTHQKAVEMNDRYLSEAAAQLHDIKARLEAVRNDHKLLTAAVEETNRSGKKAATAEARKIVSEAQKEASAIIALAEAEAMERVAAAENRLIELSAERETIAQYVEGLRAVVGKVVAAERKKREPEPANPRSSRAKGKSAD